jgi:hypothetical protein
MTRPAVQGPKVILQGEPGVGKTHAIRTLIESGLNVFVVFTEPGIEVLADQRKGKLYSCSEGLHWYYVPPVSPSFTSLQNAANLMNKFGFAELAKMAPTDRDQFRGYFEVIGILANLKCQRCGKTFGAADHLEPYDKWCVVQDSLSSLSIMALNCLVGSKPAVHEGEWGVAMFNLERLINKFAYDVRCMMVLTAHIEPEPSGIGGGVENMVATLGKKLAPKIPRPFSDVIHAYREGDKFWWSTTSPLMKLKTRNLPLSGQIPPTFKPIVTAWHEQIQREAAASAANAQVVQAIKPVSSA